MDGSTGRLCSPPGKTDTDRPAEGAWSHSSSVNEFHPKGGEDGGGNQIAAQNAMVTSMSGHESGPCRYHQRHSQPYSHRALECQCEHNATNL